MTVPRFTCRQLRLPGHQFALPFQSYSYNKYPPRLIRIANPEDRGFALIARVEHEMDDLFLRK